MPLDLSKAIELVAVLDRTRNYPRDSEGEGVQRLARGLQKASDALQVAGARIVERLAETSEWCPTDAEILIAARDIARLDSVAAGTYDPTAGASNHFEPRPPCAHCENSGWETIYTLHTARNGRWKFTKRENITADQARDLEPKLDPTVQKVYSGARRCTQCAC